MLFMCNLEAQFETDTLLRSCAFIYIIPFKMYTYTIRLNRKSVN
jgi:hypothetical protein